jgi:predicted amidohydrolase YtcJ
MFLKQGAIFRPTLLIASTIVSLGTSTHAQVPTGGIYPDAVYYDAKVITVGKTFTVSQAFAVLGEKFAAVGSNSAVLALAGPQTKRVDLHSHTVIPGLIDGHYHYLNNAGTDFKEVSLVRAKSLDEFLNIIKLRADETPAGEVLSTQSGWLPDQFHGRLPNKGDLDKAAPRNLCLCGGPHDVFKQRRSQYHLRRKHQRVNRKR